MWGIGLAAYFMAVFHRSSLSVAGLEAADRFGIGASQLAVFTVLQLLVYAAMQVPVGLMVDRFGARSVLLTGTVLLSVAQAGFALADGYGQALLARTFVGMGDAMTFICVLRLVSAWFPTRRIPLVSMLTGPVGQLGAILAAVPVTVALRELGWTSTYLTAAGIGPVIALVAWLALSDAPDRRHLRGEERLNPAMVRRSIGAVWAHPGTRLGFWIHFSTCFSLHAFSLLWGQPFLVRSEGLSEAAAGSLLSVLVVVTIIVGPVLGTVIGRFPQHRSAIALWVTASMALTWAAVLAWPGQAPVWLLVVLLVPLGVGGPTSMIGFDVARTSNPPSRQSTATGLVNIGGFVGALVTVLAIGWVLDWRTPGGGTDYTAEAFGWAMSVQFVLWALGLTQMVRLRIRARAYVAAATVRAAA